MKISQSITILSLYTGGCHAFIAPASTGISRSACRLQVEMGLGKSLLKPISLLSWRNPLNSLNSLRSTSSDAADSSANPPAETNKNVAAEGESSSMAQTLKVGSFFALWYIFNIGYNIYNKKALNAYPMPWTVAFIQIFIGVPYCFFLWMTKLRKAPKLSGENIKDLTPLAAMHLGTHMGAVISLGAGAVSFTHIVKAMEPLFSAGLSGLILGQVFALPVYATLVPIVAGVALASLKELSFTWLGFSAAMASNLFSALRGIFGKLQMGKPLGENMTPANLYGVLTVIATILLLPFVAIIEGKKIVPEWEAAVAAGANPGILAWHILASSLCYYLYNEVAFLALDSVNPVTHAVGNTIKRVVIIVASVIVFKTTMTPLAITGSTIAIIGTLLYALAKNKFK